ncbi:MAG: hypothetical protein AB8B56_02080, partial [Crocinitomicaceae bacterium]
MVSRFLLIFILSAMQSSTAQEEYIQPGLLSASITYSPSTMLNYDENNFYVTGFAEYLFDEHFSFRSDTYVFLNGEE